MNRKAQLEIIFIILFIIILILIIVAVAFFFFSTSRVSPSGGPARLVLGILG